MKIITDISYYQNQPSYGIFKPIDWGIMSDRADGVMIRAGYGSNLDSQFLRNWEDSLGSIQRGAYWYLLAGVSIEAQVSTFLKVAQKPEIGLAVDLEWRSSDGLANKPGNDYLLKVSYFLHALEESGHSPIVYSGYPHILAYLSRPSRTAATYELWADLAKYRLWTAQYSKDSRIILSGPNIPQPWLYEYMWQCSADGNGMGPMYGVHSSSIDLNLIRYE